MIDKQNVVDAEIVEDKAGQAPSQASAPPTEAAPAAAAGANPGLRTRAQIDEEYTKFCALLGDRHVKIEVLKNEMKQFEGRVSELLREPAAGEAQAPQGQTEPSAPATPAPATPQESVN